MYVYMFMYIYSYISEYSYTYIYIYNYEYIYTRACALTTENLKSIGSNFVYFHCCYKIEQPAQVTENFVIRFFFFYCESST